MLRLLLRTQSRSFGCGAAALWKSSPSSTIFRSAAVCAAPAAAHRDPRVSGFTQTRCAGPGCCGWSFGHSRGPVVVEHALSRAKKLNAVQTVEQLEQLLSEPTEVVVEMMRRLQGDIILLGAAGKIGPSLARMARRASDLAGVSSRVIGVSRFSATEEQARLQAHGVETIRCDLLDESAVAQLPPAPNVIYLAGLKFGSTEDAAQTWAMNSYLPGSVCRMYRASRIVAFSTGAVDGLAHRADGGSRETDPPQPVGEYAMSCLGHARVFADSS